MTSRTTTRLYGSLLFYLLPADGVAGLLLEKNGRRPRASSAIPSTS